MPADESQETRLLAPRIESHAPQAWTGTTGLGSAGARAYAKVFGSNPALPFSSRVAGTAGTQVPVVTASVAAPVRDSSVPPLQPQASAGPSGQGTLQPRDTNLSSWDEQAKLADEMARMRQRAAIQGMSQLYGVNPQLLAEAAGGAPPANAALREQMNSQGNQYIHDGLQAQRTHSPASTLIAYKSQRTVHSQSGKSTSKHVPQPTNKPTLNLPPKDIDTVKAEAIRLANAYHIPIDLALATVQKESFFNINEVSKDGRDLGVMQINKNKLYFRLIKKDEQGKVYVNKLVPNKLKDENGNTFQVDEDLVRKKWEYNMKVGMAILKSEYDKALQYYGKPIKAFTDTDWENVAGEAYARYNVENNWQEYMNPKSDVHKHVKDFMPIYKHYHYPAQSKPSPTAVPVHPVR